MRCRVIATKTKVFGEHKTKRCEYCHKLLMPSDVVHIFECPKLSYVKIISGLYEGEFYPVLQHYEESVNVLVNEDLELTFYPDEVESAYRCEDCDFMYTVESHPYGCGCYTRR